MDLLNPDVGDILDRVTILHLKLVHSSEGHWHDELHGLYKKLEGWALPVRLLETILSLMAENAAIFAATDRVKEARRMYDAGWDKETTLAARHLAEQGYLRVIVWNDARAGLVGELNETLGRGGKREKV